jgi:hypothetical protein
VQASGGGRHRRAHVLDDDLRHGEAERMVDDERDRPAGDRVGGEVVAVAREAAHAEEHGALRDPPVVVGQRGDLDVGGVGIGGGSAEQLAQRHRSGRERVMGFSSKGSVAGSRQDSCARGGRLIGRRARRRGTAARSA